MFKKHRYKKYINILLILALLIGVGTTYKIKSVKQYKQDSLDNSQIIALDSGLDGSNSGKKTGTNPEQMANATSESSIKDKAGTSAKEDFDEAARYIDDKTKQDDANETSARTKSELEQNSTGLNQGQDSANVDKDANSPNSAKEDFSGQGVTSSGENAGQNESADKSYANVVISISCQNIMGNLDTIKNQGLVDSIPADGYYIRGASYRVSKGTSVYNLLVKACADNGLMCSAENTVFGTYVYGIGNLMEKATSSESGWMYRVNGNVVNYSAGNCALEDGDLVEWIYVNSYRELL